MELIHPAIIERFGLDTGAYSVEKYGSGLINYTFRLCAKSGNAADDFILQKINTQVFKYPERIIQNHRKAADYLAKYYPDYFFLATVLTTDGKGLLKWKDEYWRMLPFVAHTISVDEAANPKQAFEAAQQFGKLAHKLSAIDLDSFSSTIPNFHNLTLRYDNFKEAVGRTSDKRREDAEELITAVQDQAQIVTVYEELMAEPDFRTRLMHHDTKINNVLFDEKTFEGVCVIDLDTLMPGNILSDPGDMIRTYVSPVSEEETDFDKIVIREGYYDALMNGYLSEIGADLTSTEKEVLFYSGQFMTYMQGLRFLTDYLNGDVYYGAQYPKHNFDRAKNQFILLEALNEKEKELKAIIAKYL